MRLLASTEERHFAGALLVGSERARRCRDRDRDAGDRNRQRAGLHRRRIAGRGTEPTSTPTLVERFNPFTPGAPYDRATLVEFQQALTDTPFFSYAVITLPPTPEQPDEVPLKVVVRESRLKRISIGVGYETNTGPHVEVAYRQNLAVRPSAGAADRRAPRPDRRLRLRRRPVAAAAEPDPGQRRRAGRGLRRRGPARAALGPGRRAGAHGGPADRQQRRDPVVGQLRAREPPHADHRLAEPECPVHDVQLGAARRGQPGRAAPRQHPAARRHRGRERHAARRRLPARLRPHPAVLPGRRRGTSSSRAPTSATCRRTASRPCRRSTCSARAARRPSAATASRASA